MPTKKRPVEDEPFTDNYPALRDWLRKINAQCITQEVVAGTKAKPSTYFEAWRAPGAKVIVYLLVHDNKRGWDIATPADSNNVDESLADAERRMGLSVAVEPAPKADTSDRFELAIRKLGAFLIRSCAHGRRAADLRLSRGRDR